MKTILIVLLSLYSLSAISQAKAKADSLTTTKSRVITLPPADTTSISREVEFDSYYRDRLSAIQTEIGNVQREAQIKVEALNVTLNEVINGIYHEKGINRLDVKAANLRDNSIMIRLKKPKPIK